MQNMGSSGYAQKFRAASRPFASLIRRRVFSTVHRYAGEEPDERGLGRGPPLAE